MPIADGAACRHHRAMPYFAAALLAVASLTPADDAPDCAALEPCLAWVDANAARLAADGDRLCSLAQAELPRFGQGAKRALFARFDAAPDARRYATCALAGLGASVLPAVFDDMVAHETREERWRAAQDVIRRMGAAAAGMTATWQRTATDVDESPAPRIAALRALEALGPHAIDARAAVEPLARDEDPEIREAAQQALAAMGGEAPQG